MPAHMGCCGEKFRPISQDFGPYACYVVQREVEVSLTQRGDMADSTTSTTTSTLSPHDRRALIETARNVVAQLLTRVPGTTSDTAVRNAREAWWSDVERRQQWDGLRDDLEMINPPVGRAV
jgi:hypothetical protein